MPTIRHLTGTMFRQHAAVEKGISFTPEHKRIRVIVYSIYNAVDVCYLSNYLYVCVVYAIVNELLSKWHQYLFFLLLSVSLSRT